VTSFNPAFPDGAVLLPCARLLSGVLACPASPIDRIGQVDAAELDLMARLAWLRLRDRWEDWSKKTFRPRVRSHVSVRESGGMKFGLAHGMTARHRAELAPFAVDMARRCHEDSRASAELDPVFRKLWEDGAKVIGGDIIAHRA